MIATLTLIVEFVAVTSKTRSTAGPYAWPFAVLAFIAVGVLIGALKLKAESWSKALLSYAAPMVVLCFLATALMIPVKEGGFTCAAVVAIVIAVLVIACVITNSVKDPSQRRPAAVIGAVLAASLAVGLLALPNAWWPMSMQSHPVFGRWDGGEWGVVTIERAAYDPEAMNGQYTGSQFRPAGTFGCWISNGAGNWREGESRWGAIIFDMPTDQADQLEGRWDTSADAAPYEGAPETGEFVWRRLTSD